MLDQTDSGLAITSAMIVHRLSIVVATMCVASLALAGTVEPRSGWIVINTSKPYATLIEQLEAAIKAEKMGLVTSASASEGAKAAGFAIPGNRVIGVFRIDFARRMLQTSVAAGIEAPIRFYVTENADGTATLSYKKPSFVFAPYVAEGGVALTTITSELDEIFARIADAATRPN
jgi:uncharacterized protein (DUF302 family)